MGGVVSMTATFAAPPPTNEPFILEAQVKFQGTGESNGSLGASGQNNLGFLGLETRLRLTASLSENSSFFWEGSGVSGAGQGGPEASDTGETSKKNNFLQWRQSYLQFNNLGDFLKSVIGVLNRPGAPLFLFKRRVFIFCKHFTRIVCLIPGLLKAHIRVRP